jgi:hypothetical protein
MQYVYSRYKTEETFNVVAWLKGTQQQQQHGRVAQDFYGGAVFKIIIIIIIIIIIKTYGWNNRGGCGDGARDSSSSFTSLVERSIFFGVNGDENAAKTFWTVEEFFFLFQIRKRKKKSHRECWNCDSSWGCAAMNEPLVAQLCYALNDEKWPSPSRRHKRKSEEEKNGGSILATKLAQYKHGITLFICTLGICWTELAFQEWSRAWSCA